MTPRHELLFLGQVQLPPWANSTEQGWFCSSDEALVGAYFAQLENRKLYFSVLYTWI